MGETRHSAQTVRHLFFINDGLGSGFHLMFHLANAARPPADVPRRLGHQPPRQPLQSPQDGFQCHCAQEFLLALYLQLGLSLYRALEDEDFSTVGGFFSSQSHVKHCTKHPIFLKSSTHKSAFIRLKLLFSCLRLRLGFTCLLRALRCFPDYRPIGQNVTLACPKISLI